LSRKARMPLPRRERKSVAYGWDVVDAAGEEVGVERSARCAPSAPVSPVTRAIANDWIAANGLIRSSNSSAGRRSDPVMRALVRTVFSDARTTPRRVRRRPRVVKV